MLHDISMQIFDEMPVWPGDPEVSFERKVVPLNGMKTHVTEISLSTHTGTHLDLFGHFDEGHPLKVNDLQLSLLCGPCLVMEWPKSSEKLKNELYQVSTSARKRIILKLNDEPIPHEEIYNQEREILSDDDLNILKQAGVKLLGIDNASPESTSAYGFPTHHRLFDSEIIILENLLLDKVATGIYELFCLPLPISGVNDGVPCRAILKGPIV